MGACFGSSSVCTEQYSVWAPTSAPGSASATLPARLLVTSIEPTRQTPNSPAREGSFKQKVPNFGPEQNSPHRFSFKIGLKTICEFSLAVVVRFGGLGNY